MTSEELRTEAERIISEDRVPEDELRSLIEDYGSDDREVTVAYKCDAKAVVRESWELEVPFSIAQGDRDELIEYLTDNQSGATFIEETVGGEDDRELDADTIEVRR